MIAHKFLLVLALVAGISGQGRYRLTPALVKLSENACEVVGRQSYFHPDLLIGKPWRVYYTWNMKLHEKACVDVRFQRATTEIINRIRNDMSLSLMQQPDWEAAQLLVTIGRFRQEMLLFPDENEAPGRFLVAPNDFRDTSPAAMVPLLKFQMKLIRNGKYLFFMDCQVGIAWFAMRFDEPVYRADIITAAQEFFPILSEGVISCLSARNPDEQVAKSEKKKHQNAPVHNDDGSNANKLYI